MQIKPTDINGTIPVSKGGTGATTLTGYMKGNGTGAVTASATIAFTDITGTVPVNQGGTGATTAAGARTNLGLDAGGAGDIWVEKAGDTMTGALNGTSFNILAASKASGAPSGTRNNYVVDDEFIYAQRSSAAATMYMARTLGTLVSPSAVTSGTNLANIVFSGYDGTNIQDGGLIQAFADSTVSSGTVPTGIRVLTGSSAGSRAVRVTWDSGGNMLPTGNIAFPNGSFIYSYQGSTLGTVKAGIQFDGTGNGFGFYTNNTFRGGLNTTELFFSVPIRPGEYSKSALPSAAQRGQLIYVVDDVGGAVPAFSDGTNWRRVTDRNVIS
jgi:hypothetical protein